MAKALLQSEPNGPFDPPSNREKKRSITKMLIIPQKKKLILILDFSKQDLNIMELMHAFIPRK